MGFQESTEESPQAASVAQAETIAGLQDSIEDAKNRLEELRKKLVAQEQEFEEAGGAFRDLEKELGTVSKQLESLPENAPQLEAERLSSQIKELQNKRELARQRFQVAIEMKQNIEQQIQVLNEKLEKDEQALEKLLNPEKPSPEPAVPTRETTETPLEKEPEESTASEENTGQEVPGLPGMPAADMAVSSSSKEEKPDEELLAAKEEVAQTTTAAEEAEQSLSEVQARIDALDKSIDLEQKAREATRKQADIASQTLQALNEELQTKLEENAPSEEIKDLRTQIEEAQKRLREARSALTKHSEQLDSLQSERVKLLGEKNEAQFQAERARQKAEQAQAELEKIENPFSMNNILSWLAEKGPRLLLVIVVVLVLRLLIQFVSQRIVKSITKGDSRGTRKEKENRASTLVSVFHNTALLALFAGAIIMILELVGIPVAPLLGGAAVVGLAIAFGAQNLVKDYFSGFMILLENQYGVNDVVSIGGEIGFVERITLRMTVLRNFDAVVFVPHGQVTTVSNLTHKWSRAVFDLGIAYREDVDAVMELIVALGKELREDPEFSEAILDDLEMLGVDGFADSAVMIKFFIKTQPLKQWDVKRELLRRIKKAFDERGIEIPFPHRTVYHRYEKDYLPEHLLGSPREKGPE